MHSLILFWYFFFYYRVGFDSILNTKQNLHINKSQRRFFKKKTWLENFSLRQVHWLHCCVFFTTCIFCSSAKTVAAVKSLCKRFWFDNFGTIFFLLNINAYTVVVRALCALFYVFISSVHDLSTVCHYVLMSCSVIDNRNTFNLVQHLTEVIRFVFFCVLYIQH